MKMAWPSKRHGLRAATGAFLAVLTCGGTAMAQEPSKADLAKALTLFQEGVALAAANNCAAALVKYKAVAQVKSTPQVAFNTAECEARLGQLVEALGNYRVAASAAAGNKRAANVLKEVPERIEELEARIPKLTITRGKGADTASIELDGSEIGSGQLGSAIVVDPGSHTIVAKVGNKEYLHETVKLGEKENKTFDVKISVAAAHVEPPAPEPVPDAPPPPPPEKSRVPGVAVTVVGGVVLVAGLAFLAPRGAALSKLKMDCNTAMMCPSSDNSTYTSGNLFGGLSAGFITGGAVMAVAGIVMIAKSGPAKAAIKPADGEGDKKDGEGDKKDAFWRSIQVTASAPGANVGGLGLVGRF
jgi:hypothetical protein